MDSINCKIIFWQIWSFLFSILIFNSNFVEPNPVPQSVSDQLRVQLQKYPLSYQETNNGNPAQHSFVYSPDQERVDQKLKQMVEYQYQLQLVKQLKDLDLISQLPDMIKNKQLPSGFDINQLFSLRDKIQKINALRAQESTGKNSNSTTPAPDLPITGLLKNLGNLLTSVLNGLTGMTGATGVASNKNPDDVYKEVDDDLVRLASIKGPDKKPLVNPLNEFLNSLAPVLNTVLGLLGPLKALG